MKVKLVTILALMALILTVYVASAQTLPFCSMPYYRVEVGKPVYATYFDGAKLWVVYSGGDKTNIALYLVSNNTVVQEWVSSLPGNPTAVATNDKLTLIAVATDTRKIAVYNVRKKPVFYIERGTRSTPSYIRLARLDDHYVLITIEYTGNSYWVYAYILNTTKPVAELWLRVPPTLGPSKYKVVPIDIAGRHDSLPAIASVYIIGNVNCTLHKGNRTIIAKGNAVMIDIYTLNWSSAGIPVFRKSASFMVVPGCEIGIDPYTIDAIDYVKVYYSPGAKRLFAALGLELTQVYYGVGAKIDGKIFAFMLVDAERNESLVRYTDVLTGKLDYYPLGRYANATVTAFTATIDNRVLFVGSADYNVRVFVLNRTEGLYYLHYSVSLAGPISDITTSPYAALVIATASNGQMMAFRGYDGEIYWRLPIGAQASFASIYSGFAAIGTSGGTVFAFTKPETRLYYLGLRFNMTQLQIENQTYILQTPTIIRIEGVYLPEACRVEVVANHTLEWFTQRIYFELLPSATYKLTVDNYILGVFTESILLTADVVYTLQPNSFKIPYYRLGICLLDTWRMAPPVPQDAFLNVTRLAGPEPNSPVITSRAYPLPPSGCLNLTLPRGFYTFRLVSWRYHPQIAFNVSTQVVKLWSNLTLVGNVTPYLAETVMITVTTDYGMPLSGANVTLYDPFSGVRLSGVTGAGRVNFTSVPYGNYTVIVSHPYTHAARAKLDLAVPIASLSISLQPKMYYVTIRVVDAETGAPLTQFTYTLVRGFDGFTLASTITGRNYVILKLAYGTYSLSIESPGYHGARLEQIVVTSDMMLTVRLSPIYYPVVFIVRDAIFQRNLPARLTILNVNTGSRMILNAPQGSVQVQLRTGNYTVTVDSPYAYQAVYNIVITSSRTVLLFVKPRNYTLTVIPLDAELAKPITLLGYNASGYVSCSDTGNWTLEWTGKSLTAIIPYSTSCTVHISSRWYHGATVTLPAVDKNMTLNVQLEPIKYVVVLNVKSAYGIAVPFNATIKGGPLNETIRIGGSGSVTLELRPGSYSVKVTAAYHQPAYKSFNVTGGELSISIILEPRVYPVTVIVVDSETGRQVPRAEITVMRERPTRSKPFTIIARSGATVIPLTWGFYRFEIAAPGYRARSFTLDVPKQLNATITLEPLKFPVEIKVYNAIDKNPVVNASVVLMGKESGITVKLYTGRDGSVKTELRVDVYRVIISAPHYQAYTATLTVKTAESLHVALKPVNYTVTLQLYDGVTRSPYTGEWSLQATSLTYRNYVLKLKFRGPSAIIQLPYGVYQVTVTAPKYQKVSFKLNVNMSIPKKIIHLPRETYSVTFKVIDTRGAPVANAIIRATCLDNPQVTFIGVTGGDGTTETKLPWCRYRIEVEAGGYFPRTIFADINTNGQVVPIMIRPTMAKIILDLLPAIIIAGAVIGTGIWVGIRVKRRPAGAELLGEEL